MIEIRQDQFGPLEAESDEVFVGKMHTFARQNLAVETRRTSDPILDERIRSGMRRARSHGFTWESSIAKFVTLMLRFAPNFDQHPSCEKVLGRKDVESESRAELLFTDVTPAEWAEIEDNYEPAAWQQFATGPVL